MRFKFCLLPHWTMPYLSLRRPGQQPIQYYSSFEGVSVFDETRPFFYYLVEPGQQPMQYYSSVEAGICLWWDQAFLLLPETNNHYPMPRLNMVINYELAVLSAASGDKAFLVKSIEAYSLCPVDWSLLSMWGWRLPIEISAGKIWEQIRPPIYRECWYAIHRPIYTSCQYISRPLLFTLIYNYCNLCGFIIDLITKVRIRSLCSSQNIRCASAVKILL